VLVAVVAGAIAAFGSSFHSRPVYACTGGPGQFQHMVARPESGPNWRSAIAVVTAIEVGGPENTAPAVTPDHLAGTPFPLAASPTPSGFDLTGIGATLQVERAIVGDLAAQVEVDMVGRRGAEEALRLEEAGLQRLLPCPVGFGLEPFEAGKSYLIFLFWEEALDWYSIVKLDIVGDYVVTGGDGRHDAYTIRVEQAIADRYFPDLPFEAGVRHSGLEPDEEPLGTIASSIVPLDYVVAAIQAIRAEAAAMPTVSPEPVETPEPIGTLESAAPAQAGPVAIAPPDVGDGGLR
jgi:hypothetical protein